MNAATNAGHEIELMVLDPGDSLDTRTRKKSKSSLKITQAQTGFETSAGRPEPRPAGPIFNEARDTESQKRQRGEEAAGALVSVAHGLAP